MEREDLLRSRRYGSCWDRIDRAYELRKSFADTWNQWLAKEPYEITVSVHPDGTGEINVWPRWQPKSEAKLSLLLGEFLYQLRACLDGAIYETAVELTGQDPPPRASKLEFPIARTVEEWEAAVRRGRLSGLRDDQVDMVRRFQPFRLPSEYDHRIWFPTEALMLLNDMARQDRHRRLHVVGTWGHLAAPEVFVDAPASVEWVRVEPDGIIESRHLVARFKLRNYSPSRHGQSSVHANPRIAMDVVVDVGPQPRDTDDTLNRRTRAMRVSHAGAHSDPPADTRSM